jgi:hypothetical protein
VGAAIAVAVVEVMVGTAIAVVVVEAIAEVEVMDANPERVEKSCR